MTGKTSKQETVAACDREIKSIMEIG
jgi:hypothetical protein